MRYYIGLDNGGTVTKAAIFDRQGRQLGAADMPTASFSPKPGCMERDMEEMWQANCAVIRKALEQTGIPAEKIAGVGICGHGKGLYLWGRDNKPACYGIPSSDNRAYQYPLRWAADGTEQAAFALTCQHVMACQPVALLAWMKDNRPEVYNNIQWVFECKDYVRFRLTGEVFGELTDYSGTGLVNLHTKDYDPEILKLFGIEEVEDALPPLRNSTDICGYVTEEAAALCGLLPGTPVIGGMFDIDACALAVNVMDPSHICMIAGTWSINEYPRQKPVLDGSVKMNSLFCLPGYYLIEESSATSAGNNAWFLDNFLPELKQEAKAQGSSIYDMVNSWVEETPPEEFVPVFLPFVMASNVHPNARGSFVGLCANHTRRHILRSIYEGIAFCHRYHLEKLLATREMPPEGIRLAGGVANSPVWVQMFADILQLKVETVEVKETGAQGCAIAVAYAVGDYVSMEEAAANMCSLSAAVYPDPGKKAIYDRKYALYCKTIQCLDGLWDGMQLLAEA
ncbi:MAG: carbohydrate kinase [Lachnospiraceae bacterium]|nr:carbohydrate kinase [Lachnospiraceae bacterium]